MCGTRVGPARSFTLHLGCYFILFIFLQVVAPTVLPEPTAERQDGVAEPGDGGWHVLGAAGGHRHGRHALLAPVLRDQVP